MPLFLIISVVSSVVSASGVAMGRVAGVKDDEAVVVGDVELIEGAGGEQAIDGQLLQADIADPGLSAEGL